MDLPDLVQAAEDACGQAIDTDPSFVSLAAALHHLGLLDRYAVFRGLRRDVLEDLLDPLLRPGLLRPAGRGRRAGGGASGGRRTRSCRWPSWCSGPTPTGTTGHCSPRRDAAAADESPVPFLRGAFLGLLVRDPRAAGRRAGGGGGRTGPRRPRPDGDRRRPARRHARGLADVDPARGRRLVAAVDDLLKAAEWEPFLVMLPRLRAAFERLSEPQRDSLAATVARRYGLAAADDVRADDRQPGRDRPRRARSTPPSPLPEDWPL